MRAVHAVSFVPEETVYHMPGNKASSSVERQIHKAPVPLFLRRAKSGHRGASPPDVAHLQEFSLEGIIGISME